MDPVKFCDQSLLQGFLRVWWKTDEGQHMRSDVIQTLVSWGVEVSTHSVIFVILSDVSEVLAKSCTVISLGLTHIL